jgi:hypothetical protein
VATTKTPGQAKSELKASLLAHLTASTITGIAVAWGNKHFDRAGKTEYLRATFQHLPGTLAALGNTLYRRPMLASIDVFVQEGRGEDRTDAITEVLLAWLEKLNVSNFRLRDPVGPNDIGVFDGFNHTNVSARLEYDALRT